MRAMNVRNMNVRAKLLLLLGIVSALFLAGLYGLVQANGRGFAQISSDQAAKTRAEFDTYLARRAEALTSFVSQTSAAPGMLAAIQGADREWIEENVTDALLSKYGAHVFWVYDKDRKLIYSRDTLYTDGLHEAPVPRSGFDEALGAEHLAQFFAENQAGLLEVRGTTIPPNGGMAGKEGPLGYLFAARVWTPEEIKLMSSETGNTLGLIETKYQDPIADARKGEMVFSKVLPGWDGSPVRRLTVQHQSPVLAHFMGMTMWLLIWLALFVMAILATLAFALRRWVWRPLEIFSTSLRSEKMELLQPIERDRGEVGELARLIVAFFQQRESLLEETRAARQTEKVLVEVTEEFRTERKMEAIGRLARGVSHDFSNLLTIIIGYTGLLRERLRSVNLPVQESDAILRAGQQSARLTRQLLAFSQRQVLHPRVIDLNRLIIKSEDRLREEMGGDVDVRIRTDARHGRVRADPTQIEEVLSSLASNARDAMPKGGVLTITTGDTVVSEDTEVENGKALNAGRYITLEFADTGMGMPSEVQERIFEPFYTTKPPGQGTGLGMASVYGVVTQSGGAISMSSKEGEGTTFLIHLPMELAEEDPLAPELPVGSQGGGAETILVVEEEKLVRELVCSVLEGKGYRVITADGASAALALAAEQSGEVALVVMDAELHRKPGSEVVRELATRWPTIKVLLLAGYTEEQSLVEQLSDSVSLIVEKPFTIDELTARVRQLLDRTSRGGHSDNSGTGTNGRSFAEVVPVGVR